MSYSSDKTGKLPDDPGLSRDNMSVAVSVDLLYNNPAPGIDADIPPGGADATYTALLDSIGRCIHVAFFARDPSLIITTKNCHHSKV